MSAKQAMLADQGLSQLVMIDVQEKLAAVMPPDELNHLIQQAEVLLQAAKLLEVPVLITEQYPKGLGNTLPVLKALCDAKPIEKQAFSCVQVPQFSRQLVGDRPQIILMGMETHICVLQTALDLIARGKQVMVVEDAVISRNPSNKRNALARMQAAGCVVTNTESVVFEWLRVAQGDTFKAISKLIR